MTVQAPPGGLPLAGRENFGDVIRGKRSHLVQYDVGVSGVEGLEDARHGIHLHVAQDQQNRVSGVQFLALGQREVVARFRVLFDMDIEIRELSVERRP